MPRGAFGSGHLKPEASSPKEKKKKAPQSRLARVKERQVGQRMARAKQRHADLMKRRKKDAARSLLQEARKKFKT